MSSISRKTMFTPWGARERRREQWRRWKRTYRAKKKAERQARAARANASIKDAVESLIISNIIRIMVVSPPEVQTEIATHDYIGYS